MAKKAAARNDPASSGTSGVVANRAPKPALTAPLTIAGGLDPAIAAAAQARAAAEGGGGTGPSGTDPGPDYGGPGSPQASGETPTPPAAPGFDPLALAGDWYKAFFDQYGLPSDTRSEILRILTQYAADPSTAQALAQQYLRTTDWFQKTYPGFNQGISNGLFTDETGYRGYLNAVNQVFNQYLGRHVTGDELSGYLASGYNPGHVGNLLQGQAWAGANANDVRYLTGAFDENGPISSSDLTTLGNERAGIDTARGQTLDAMVARAQQRLQSIFQGKLGTPAGLTLGPTGLAAPSLSGTKQAADLAA